MRSSLRPLATVAVGGMLALSLAACGGSSASTSTDSGSSTGDQPKAAASPVAALTNLTGEKTEVVVDPGFLMGLESLKLTPGVVGKATLTDGTLAFPITGGNATYYTPGSRTPYVESSIEHVGSGISLTDGKTKVELTNFVVDAGKSMLTGDVSANGASVVKGAPLFFLDGSTLQPLQVDKAAGTGVLFGTTVSLTKAAADLLNMTYKTTALTEFFKVGVARITLKLA
ncbi:MAG: hypothetical protein LC789_06845 [Actinobacteria bacterium]|nr:hypothetical protein [Actinomycetota bacterium]MCA1720550.1 hypothetical protein [Actinomycetota bacterium]